MKPAVLITGGARRVGREIALYLARHGYDIALHFNQSADEAHQTADDIRKLGARCEPLQADLADAAAYETLIAQAHAAFPRLFALINNASVFDRGSFLESSYELYQREFRINLEAPMFLTQAFARQIRKGCVVNMLDTMITRNKHSYFFYLLSKKNLFDFTRMTAVELGPEIRVNGICPGYLLPAEGWGDDYRKSLEARLPLGKIATTEEVAKAVHMLIDNASLTGQILFVDGGESLV